MITPHICEVPATPQPHVFPLVRGGLGNSRDALFVVLSQCRERAIVSRKSSLVSVQAPNSFVGVARREGLARFSFFSVARREGLARNLLLAWLDAKDSGLDAKLSRA